VVTGSRSGPGDLERAVMRILWAHVPEDAPATDGLTVREVLPHLPGRRLAYTTVMTVLDRLTKKQLVRRHRDGRAWRYVPSATRGEMTAQAMRRRLEGLAEAERRSALVHFVGRSTPQDVAELRHALDEAAGATEHETSG
jgi:predicted transcriptional regulator